MVGELSLGMGGHLTDVILINGEYIQIDKICNIQSRLISHLHHS